MTELLLGLVGISVLIGMLLQINRVSYEHTAMVIDIRNEVADRMVAGPSAYDADYLSGWEAGVDRRRYTQDDTRRAGDAAGFLGNLETAMQLSELQYRLGAAYPEDPFLDFNSSTAGSVSEVFGIFRETTVPVSVDLLPMVRRLVADFESLKIEHEIYMPWTQNLMREE